MSIEGYYFTTIENLFEKVEDEFEDVGDQLNREKQNFETLSEEVRKELEQEELDNVEITEN